MPTGVYLARHGQTAYNLEGRFQGHLPVPLDETGRAQAGDLAARALDHGFRALWCSPLLRARQTADIVAAVVGLEPVEDTRLVETDSGDWTDLTFSQVRAATPELFDAFATGEASFAFPGGESFVEQERRVAAALQEIERGELPALVVCHGMVIRAALRSRAGEEGAPFQRVSNGALVALEPAERESSATGEDGRDDSGYGASAIAQASRSELGAEKPPQ